MANEGIFSKIKVVAEVVALAMPPLWAYWKYRGQGMKSVATEIMYGYGGVKPGGDPSTPYGHSIFDAAGLQRLVDPDNTPTTRDGMWMWAPYIGVKIGEGCVGIANAAIAFIRGLF